MGQRPQADDWWGSALGAKPASMKAPTASAATSMGANPTAKTPKKKATASPAYKRAKESFDSARDDYEYDHTMSRAEQEQDDY
jgi:hypothetical protein